MFHEPWIWMGIYFGTLILGCVVVFVTRSSRPWDFFSILMGVEAFCAAFFAPSLVFSLGFVLVALINIFGGVTGILRNTHKEAK